MQIEQLDPREWINGDGSTERAVSPVIGVILMVAITVVLAGVIGIMVFGIADDLGDSTPSATLTIDDVNVDQTTEEFEFTLEHDGGDSVVAEDLNVIFDGTTYDTVAELSDLEEEDELSAGESVLIDGITHEGTEPDVDENQVNVHDIEDGEEIRITHGPSDSVLGSYEIQSNDISEA